MFFFWNPLLCVCSLKKAPPCCRRRKKKKKRPPLTRRRRRRRDRNDYITYTMDDDRQSVGACAVLPPRDRVRLRRLKLERHDQVVVDLKAVNVAVESRKMGTMSSRSLSAEADKTCKLRENKMGKRNELNSHHETNTPRLLWNWSRG